MALVTTGIVFVRNLAIQFNFRFDLNSNQLSKQQFNSILISRIRKSRPVCLSLWHSGMEGEVTQYKISPIKRVCEWFIYTKLLNKFVAFVLTYSVFWIIRQTSHTDSLLAYDTPRPVLNHFSLTFEIRTNS